MGICLLCCEALDILKGATEIWEINASFIMMSENPTNRDRSQHVDVKVHFLRELVRDGVVALDYRDEVIVCMTTPLGSLR